MSKSYSSTNSTAPKFSSGSVKSPSNTPEEQIKTIGGMPPEKTEKQINDANDPSKRGPAPDVSRGT